ncbi:M43 family zinc metalloprotease [Rufibacter radiotolerans]|uniref:M43 family zinc metalloprotease n=1 Tax=Rufibacter radiotolerans TaxID=1379910 RepID=UPI0009E5647D|nr:M43 family zinc metalloprotease [Rufibacter radiotolerans]
MITRVLACLFLLVIGMSAAVAQNRTCGTMDYVRLLERERPNLRAQLQLQAREANTLKGRYENRALGGVTTIPVVVHVVYNGTSQNISNVQIQTQIAALNKDFRKLNGDTASIPAAFKGLAGDAGIEFCLAQRTPDGEPTNGITRTQTSVNGFKIDNSMKFTTSGGKDIWDPSKYLNIWVVALSSEESVLGYAQFPNSGSPATDGVVVDYRCFGTTGTAVRPFNKGRTATHEIGHWLNLFHIWGDESCGNDQVEDTPTQEEENGGCPVYPSPSCSNTSDMFMNYMDYTDDACMYMFTNGQVNVMQTAITRYRPTLLTSQGCAVVQVPDLEAALIEVTSPSKIICATSVSPKVVLRNRGAQTLTSAQIQYRVDNGPAQTYTWTGSLASFTNVTVSLPAFTVPAGAHTISYSLVSRNNAATDADATNDAISASFQVQGSALPLAEGFEGTAFPPAGWAILNPNQDLTWARTTKAAKTGSASAFMQNIQYTSNGLVDELVLPPLDLTSRTAPTMTFQVAYSLLSESGFSDTLEVWVSTNCGESFQRVYRKFDRDLVTASPAFRETEFIPTASEWRLETIDLAAFATAKTAILKFRHITDYENNLYLDDVKVDGVPMAAEEERAQQAVQVTPNPTTGMLYVSSPEARITRVQVCDAVGKILQDLEPRHVKGQPLKLMLPQASNGVYFLKMTTDKGPVVRRVMLVR